MLLKQARTEWRQDVQKGSIPPPLEADKPWAQRLCADALED